MLRKFAVAAALMLATTGLTAASAAPSHVIHNIYYSDASKTTLVGERILSCNYGTYSYGQQTPYFDHNREDECDGGGSTQYCWYSQVLNYHACVPN